MKKNLQCLIGSIQVILVACMTIGFFSTASGQFIDQSSGTFENLTDIFAVDHQTVYAVGVGNTLLKTTNGGFNWTDVPTGMGNPDDTLMVVYFFDDQEGFVILTNPISMNSAILKTVNGGNSFTLKYNGPFGLTDMHFADDSLSLGYVVGDQGNILASNDFGDTWSQGNIVSPTSNLITSVFFLDSQHGFIVTVFGELYETNDGGQNWALKSLGASDSTIYKIDFPIPSHGFISGGEKVYRSVDGGDSWTSKLASDRFLADIDFANQFVGMAVGENGKVIGTTDGGDNWMELNAGGSHLTGISFVDPNVGFICGQNGGLLKYFKGNISGEVKDGNGDPVDSVTVLLLKPKLGGGRMDTMGITTNMAGVGFVFTDIPAGFYKLLAIPTLTDRNLFFSTYYPSAFKWKDGNLLGFDQNFFNKIIELIDKPTPPVTGIGTIKGILRQGSNKRGPGDPLNGIDVSLISKQTSEVVMTDITKINLATGDSGYFEFENVPAGSYNLYVDIPGLSVDSSANNDIEVNDSSVQEFELDYDTTGINVHLVSGTGIKPANNGIIVNDIYPNPAYHELYIDLNRSGLAHVNLEVYNVIGELAYRQTFTDPGAGKLNVDLSGLSKGVYLLKLQFTDQGGKEEKMTRKLVIQGR